MIVCLITFLVFLVMKLFGLGAVALWPWFYVCIPLIAEVVVDLAGICIMYFAYQQAIGNLFRKYW